MHPFLTSSPLERLEPEELKKYEEVLAGLRARFLFDDSSKDQRGPRNVLNAKYLAAKDVERAAESLKTYRELLEDLSSGEAAASAR